MQHIKRESETDFSSDNDYYEFANKIPTVGNGLQSFLYEPVYKLKKT